MMRNGYGNVYTDREIEVLISWWMDFVAECAGGITTERSAFVDDLGIRSALQVILDGMRPRVVEQIEALIAEADEQYQALERVDETFLLDPTLLAKYPREPFFWLYGVPVTVTWES